MNQKSTNRILASLIALTAFIGTGLATAQTLEITEYAHELVLGDVTLPSSTAGTLIFRSCESCDPVALPVRRYFSKLCKIR